MLSAIRILAGSVPGLPGRDDPARAEHVRAMFDRLSRRLRAHGPTRRPPLTPEQRAERQRWQQRWNLPIILAAVVPLFATSPANRAAEIAIGLGSWAIFAVDLFVQRRIVPDYLSRRNGRIDLAIVVLTFPFYLLPGVGGMTAILVLARLARIARLLVATAGLRRFAARLGRIAVFAGLIVLVASFVAYWAEHPTNPEYATVGDAVWWGIVTLTTVGYGDIVPETSTGRFAGIAIMFTGVATIGILAGSLASLFHLGDQDEPAGEAEPGEAAPLREEIAALRSELREVDRRLGQLADRVQEA
jgi:voltage-gated potassium channel